jgi:hypothetical protein
MSKETDCIIAAIVASGIEHAVTDINTAGVHAKTGNHYKTDCQAATPTHAMDTTVKGDIGRAVDFAQKKGDGKSDTPELFAIFKFFMDAYGRKGQLSELYYAGPEATECVRSGKVMLWTDVAKSTRDAIRSNHHNHVHIAVPKGVFLKPPNTPIALVEEDDMPKPDSRVDACRAPGGGVWTLTFDGGVRATGGAPFFGSYPGLPPSKRKGKRNFIAIEAEGDGYTIFSDDDQGSSYHFDAKVFERIQNPNNPNRNNR